MSTLKVCMVTTSFPRWPKDSRQPLVLETARALQRQGVQVRVIALHSPGAKSKEVLESIEVFRPRYMWPNALEILQKEGGGLPVMWRKSRVARYEFPLAAAAQALAIVRYGGECDIVHAHWTLSAMSAWAGRFFHRRPYIVTVHGSDIFQATRIPLIRSVTKTVLSRAGHVIAVSQSLADAVLGLGISAAHVQVIPDGIDIERFKPSSRERDPLILFVGFLIQRKGADHLLRAMPRVLKEFPEYRLAIIGEGPQEKYLMALASQLGLASHVIFVRPESQEDIRQWMQRARLFVLPSLEEALGIVLLEALASGTPCIGTRVGGIPEVISSEVGQLVPPASPNELANAIIAVLSDPETWQSMSRNARRMAEEKFFTWNQVADRLVDIYHSILSIG